MTNPPKGMWKCPQCGAFVDEFRRVCPDCRYDKLKAQEQLYKSQKTTTPKVVMSGTIENVQSSDEGGGLAGFFMLMAWVMWIGGLVAAIFLGRTEEYSRYSGTYYEYNIVLIVAIYVSFVFAGALSMAIGRVLRYLDIIATNTARMRITIERSSQE